MFWPFLSCIEDGGINWVPHVTFIGADAYYSHEANLVWAHVEDKNDPISTLHTWWIYKDETFCSDVVISEKGDFSCSIILDIEEPFLDIWVEDPAGTQDFVQTELVIQERPTCSFGDCDKHLSLMNGVGIDWVLIDGENKQDPLGRYQIQNDFYIMTTEVTQAMFLSVMGYNPVVSDTYGKSDSSPVYNTSWHMAASFANALSVFDEKEECYTCSGERKCELYRKGISL